MGLKKKLFRLILDVYEVKGSERVKVTFKGTKFPVSIIAAIGALRVAELDLLESKLLADKVMENEVKEGN